METFNRDVAQMFRRFAARWLQFNDVVSALHAVEDGGRSKMGELARRLLDNVQHRTTYPDSFRNTLRSDRANALAALRGPLAEAIGHMVTIEVTTAALEAQMQNDQARLSRELLGELRDTHEPLLRALHKLGVSYGHYTVLEPEHLRAIASYILRKAETKTRALEERRRKRGGRGDKSHFYWKPHSAGSSSGGRTTNGR